MLFIKLSLFFFFGFGTPSPHSLSDVDSVKIKTTKLRRLYHSLSSSKGDAEDLFKDHFFNEFPASFQMLNALYGYNDKKNAPNPLYEDAYDHIEEFFKLGSFVNKTLFYKKIIAISVGGRWDADAINYFQTGLREKVLGDLKLTANILANMPDDKIKGFWHFYFDSPHRAKQIDKQLLPLKNVNSRIYKLMTEAFDAIPLSHH